MRHLKILILTLIVSSIAAFSSASAQTYSNEYRQSVAKILDLTGTKTIMSETLANMYSSMGIMTQQQAEDIVNEWLDTEWDAMIDATAKAYSQYFTTQDLRNIVEFYQTPTGQKFSRNSAGLSQAAQEAFTKDPKISSSLENIIKRRLGL